MRAKSAYDAALTKYQGDVRRWEDEHEHVEELLYMATNLDDVYEQSAADSRMSLRVKSGEHILVALPDASGVVEPRATGGSYQGGSAGVSFRIAKGVTYRVGQHRGTFQPGPQVQKAIDSGGDLYITTARVVYSGTGLNREWAFEKTVDVFHSDNWVPDWGVTYMAVTNRQKTSGFAYPMSVARKVRDRLQLALAVYDGTVQEMATGLREQEREVKAAKPVEPARPPELGA